MAKYVEKLVARPMSALERTSSSPPSRRRSRTSPPGRMVVVVDDEDRENEGDLVMAAQFVTPDAINFMTRQAGGWICLALTPERCDELGLELMAAKNESRARDAVHGDDRGARGRHDRHQRPRPGAHDAGRGRPDQGPGRHRHARPRAPAEGQGRRRARAHRPHRGVDRPRAARGPEPGRRDLRDPERGRLDGARRRPRGVLPQARPEDDHDRRPDRLPAPPRQARRARRRRPRCRPASATSSVVGYRSLVDDKHHVALVKGDVDGKDGRARARALRVPDRRRLPLAALRLRRAARERRCR